ncbi:MAG: ATPase, T2SS/T4P/T4SS family, partial [Myxococcota bacterium]
MNLKPLGEILVGKYDLPREKLEEAIEIQKVKNVPIGDVLVSIKAITEETLAKAMGEQLGLEYVDEIPTDSVDPDMVKDIPINFAKQFHVLPVSRQDGTLKVVMADPLNTAALDAVSSLLKGRVKLAVSTRQKVMDAINSVYDKRARQAESVMDDLAEADLSDIAHELEEPEDLLDASDEAPIIRLVNSLFAQAVKERASDIHIEPFEKEIVVRFRIDGVLYEIIKPP